MPSAYMYRYDLYKLPSCRHHLCLVSQARRILSRQAANVGKNISSPLPPITFACETNLCSDVAVLVQSFQSVVQNGSPLLEHGQQLVLQLVTHLYVLVEVDGFQELHRGIVGRGAWGRWGAEENLGRSPPLSLPFYCGECEA